ncbi:hypothetical protein HHI36_007156 [Cryptolaemus montrouzieri]|uniref:Uncharacterized protein n=1 Tax=Cryptolaemus montrouzieri TaxID=559131 RepID=A0ABD2MNP1_9CUCU
MFVKCVFLAFAVTAVAARSTTGHQNSITQEEHKARSEDSHSYYGDIRYLYKVYQECSATDFSSCLKLKLVAALDRVAKSTDFTIFDGVTFVKDESVPSSQPKSEVEIEATLPRSLEEKDSALNTMLTDRVSNFFNTHSVQVKLPSMTDLQRSFTDEARKKGSKGGKGGGGAYMLLPLILGGTLVPIALGALALLAGKALIVSKLALVLAGIIGLKKLLGGGGGGGHQSGHEVVVSGGHSGWGRSYEKDQAQNVAYSAYAKKTR